jgi:REP element-mobilizing transposase RayT
MTKTQNHPNRKSIRLKDYDYSTAGRYFVTLAAKDKGCPFGTIYEGKVLHNGAGKIICASLEQLELTYPYVVIDVYCLMPNHLHAVLFLLDSAFFAPEDPVRSMKIKPLGQLIGALKTVSTKNINLLDHTPGRLIWQRNYYDRVIRNDQELDRIREYILANPLRWPKEPG